MGIYIYTHYTFKGLKVRGNERLGEVSESFFVSWVLCVNRWKIGGGGGGLLKFPQKIKNRGILVFLRNFKS
jgi:hypothetical protein